MDPIDDEASLTTESNDDDDDDDASFSSTEYYPEEDNNEDEQLQDEPFDEQSDEDELNSIAVPKSEKHADSAIGDDDMSSEDDEDDDDDDDVEEEDLVMDQPQIVPKPVEHDHHPECIIHNTEEVETMSLVIRNRNGHIIDQFHKTLPFLTKYERTKLIGLRVQQLNEGSNPLVKVVEGMDNFQIAGLELQEKRMPFIIRRLTPNGNYEYWKLEDLEIL
jgi:DNA-directed RNA polymerase I, II, and III subunit RPABC2